MTRTANSASTRAKATKTNTAAVQETTAVAEESVAAVADSADENVNECVEEEKQQEVVEETKKEEEPLKDSDEIEVISIVPHVSYKDNYTSDFYRWDEPGHVEFMTYETLVRMRRNYRSYFDNMWLKPNDERVIKKFGLVKLYDKNDFLMDENSYTVDNINNVLDAISEIKSKDMKNSVADKIKDMVASGGITNINVIKAIEKKLNIDLVSSI